MGDPSHPTARFDLERLGVVIERGDQESAMAVLRAFTLEQAARVARVSERRIRYWDQKDVLSPSLVAEAGRRTPYGRIYSFQDLVGLRTLGQLRDRHRFSLQRLRQVGSYLKKYFDRPWSTLRFYVDGKNVLFQDPNTGDIISTSPLGQKAIPYFLDKIATETERDAVKLTIRTPDEIGQIAQNRYVLHNAPVIAGTRIPTAVIWEFHREGYDTPAILREFPRLEPIDVQRAIEFEEDQRKQRKAS
jgi:uncharacterized protein (DUF433 family)